MAICVAGGAAAVGSRANGATRERKREIGSSTVRRPLVQKIEKNFVTQSSKTMTNWTILMRTTRAQKAMNFWNLLEKKKKWNIQNKKMLLCSFP